MMKTDKLLPLINKINQDKKKLNNSKPKFGLPDKTQAKLDAKPIITNQDGQDLFPGVPTLIKGKGPGTPITMRNTNPQIALTPYGAAFMQPNMNYNFAGNSVLELPAAQMGGNPQQDQTMQIIQIYAQMKQMDPNELIKKIQALPQDQQQEAIQSIAQEVQTAMAQQEQAQAGQEGQEGQEPMPEEGMMSHGGEPCIDCFDHYNPSPQAQDLNWYYKKAKGGMALPKHQWATSQTGTPQLGNPTMNPYLLQKIQESMQTQNTKAAPTTQDILNEARKMPVMTSESTSVAAAQQNKKQLDKDIKDYGTFENAQKAKAIKKAQKEQEQSQLYETVEVNPNQYALAAMSSPYTGNDPRIIRDAANMTNKQMAPIAAGAAAATVAPFMPSAHQVSHGIHNIFTHRLLPSVIPGSQYATLGNAFTVDMLTDAYERAPAWGNALDKAMKTGSKEDVKELLRLSALQGLDISAIAGLPALISSGAKLPKSLQKLRNIGQTTKFAQTVKEFEGLIHAGKKASKKNLAEEEDPTTGKWERYEAAVKDFFTTPNSVQYVPDQTFIPESTGIYPNYLNIPQNVAVDYYGNRKEGGSALPQHQGRISQTGQNQIAPRDKTNAVIPNVKGIQQMDAFNQAVKNLYGPYTSVSYPDLQTKTPGDSVHLYPGQGGVYFRDFANLVGFSDKTPVDLYNLSKDPRVVVRQDSSWVNANPQYMKNLPSSVRDSLKKQMQPITGKKGGGEAFPQANEYPTDWASYSGNQYQKGKQTGKKIPNYEPNWLARRTSVPGQILAGIGNTLPYLGSIMGKGVYDIGYGLLHEGAPAWVKNAPVTYDDLSYYMMNRRYLNQDPNPTYDKIIQNLSPEELERISGPMFKEGGEAFPQAQTYLPYSRLKRFAQGGPDKPVKGKMDPSGGDLSEEDLAKIEAEQAAMQAAAQAEQAEMNKALGYGFYGFDDYVQPYEGMVSPKPGSIPSNQDVYTTPSYFGTTDRYFQTTRPVTLQGAQEIALANNLGAYGITPAVTQRTQAVTSPQVSSQTSPVAAPANTPGTTTTTKVDDSKWQTNSNVRKNYFELGVQPKANVKMRPDENTFQNQSLAVPISLGFGNNKWGVNVSGGVNFDKSIGNPATVVSSDATSPNTSPVKMTTTPITFGATRTGTNSKLGLTGGWSPDSGDFNVGANYTLKFGKKPEQRDGGSFETRPNFMFAEGGDTDDQWGGQLDMDTIYAIMKSGGFAKDPKKKKGKDWDPNDFMSYMRNQGLKKKVGGEMLPMHQGATSQTGTPTAGTLVDPTGNKDWTYSYDNGAWSAYNKGKKYDISKNPKFKSSVDKLNAAYPGGKDPNAAAATNSNTANSGTTNSSTTTSGATDNKTDATANSSNNASMRPSATGAISANPIDYLNMVNSQAGNKGIVGGITALANAANIVGYLGTGWGSGEKKDKSWFKTNPNLSVQEANQNKQAKTDIQQKSNEYQNHYVNPQTTPEVDPLAQGDFMSSLDSNMPLQQNYTSGYDAYRMEEDGKNPSMMQSRQPSTLSTTQYDDNVRPTNRVPLTPPMMRPEDQPSPYEQFQQDVNDPNSIYYNFNERGDGSNRITNTAPAIMDINAYPFDYSDPNSNPYQRAYRRGGFIYLPQHQVNPIVVSGMQGQGQSMNLSQNNNLSQPSSNPYNLYSTQTPEAIQNSPQYKAIQAANEGTDTTGGTPSNTPGEKKAAPKFRPGVMDFGEVGSNGKHLTFDVAGASRAVGGLGQIKDYLAGINADKQADELASKLNTSEFMPVAQVGGISGNMQDYGDYLVNPTQGPSFRVNAYTQAQKQSNPYMEKALLYGRMGGSLDMYEDGEEYDLTQEEIDQILAAGGTVEYI